MPFHEPFPFPFPSVDYFQRAWLPALRCLDLSSLSSSTSITTDHMLTAIARLPLRELHLAGVWAVGCGLWSAPVGCVCLSLVCLYFLSVL